MPCSVADTRSQRAEGDGEAAHSEGCEVKTRGPEQTQWEVWFQASQQEAFRQHLAVFHGALCCWTSQQRFCLLRGLPTSWSDCQALCSHALAGHLFPQRLSAASAKGTLGSPGHCVGRRQGAEANTREFPTPGVHVSQGNSAPAPSAHTHRATMQERGSEVSGVGASF